MRNAARPKPHPAEPSDLYIDARQAAGLLKISLPTLYTYVTRKNIRTSRPPGSRESWYLRSDVERLKEGRSGASPRPSTPGLTATTAITLLSDGHAYYRGQRAVDLAASATLEEVARSSLGERRGRSLRRAMAGPASELEGLVEGHAALRRDDRPDDGDASGHGSGEPAGA